MERGGIIKTGKKKKGPTTPQKTPPQTPPSFNFSKIIEQTERVGKRKRRHGEKKIRQEKKAIAKKIKRILPPG